MNTRPPRAAGAPPIEQDEPVPETAPETLPPGALCARGEHLIQDGGRDALVRAREIFAAVTVRNPGEACGHAGLARALTALVQRGIDQDDALIERAVREARAGVEADGKSPVARAALRTIARSGSGECQGASWPASKAERHQSPYCSSSRGGYVHGRTS